MQKKTVFLTAADPSLVPLYGTSSSAGADIRAWINEAVVIQPGSFEAIPTGIKIAVPEGYEMQLRPRSGLARNWQITVLNSPGTIDSDYRGEIHVILINHGKRPFTVEPRMRIAQLVLAPVVRAEFVLQDQALETTQRGEGAFGHTGLH